MTVNYDKSKHKLVFTGTPEDIEELKKLYDESTKLFSPEIAFKQVIDLNTMIAHIESWVMDEYRPLFKGKKQGSMGDRYGCIQKMAMFFIVHPQFTKDQILEATKSYINGFGHDCTYMMQADYFIFKQLHHQGKDMITSKLLTCLEDGPEQYVSKDFFDSIN